jgi:hypothetical protein
VLQRVAALLHALPRRALRCKLLVHLARPRAPRRAVRLGGAPHLLQQRLALAQPRLALRSLALLVRQLAPPRVRARQPARGVRACRFCETFLVALIKRVCFSLRGGTRWGGGGGDVSQSRAAAPDVSI